MSRTTPTDNATRLTTGRPPSGGDVADLSIRLAAMLLLLSLGPVRAGDLPNEPSSEPSNGALDQPHFMNDRAVKRSIEAQARGLADAKKTVDYAMLRKQLIDRKRYDAGPPPTGALTEQGRDLYDKVDDGVLIIARMYLCGKCDRLHANCATGFVVSEDGLAVTNYHIVDRENTVTMVAMTRDMKVFPVVEVLAGNRDDDAALIRLGGAGFTALPIARSAKVGDVVHVVSHPRGRFYSYSRGHIARFFMMPKRNGARRISVTAEYAGGSSGGPIFNDAGQVVAMVTTADARSDPKIVFYDTVPFVSILELFADRAGDAADTGSTAAPPR